MQGQQANSARRGVSRLPVIAPRQQDPGLMSNFEAAGPPRQSSSSLGQSRSRLPPRSRSGCWTCRDRKVKCGEERPICAQCTRLGHTCDYNPRLAFKDDTPRIIERMQECSIHGSSVWDPRLPAPNYGGSARSQEDRLPQFATLVTDEERERKAELQQAGTYMVVANPGSFASLPEYRNRVTTNTMVQSRQLHVGGLSSNNENYTEYLGESISFPADPNIIILRTFEDVPEQATGQNSTTDPMVHSHSIPQSGSWPCVASSLAGILPTETISRVEEAQNGGRDAFLLKHYKSHISPRVLHVGPSYVDQVIGKDSFEIEAKTFPALFHAMMAISALSLALRSPGQYTDTTDHYQQVIPMMRQSIKSDEDSISDGALFTHYLLYIYEIASGHPLESNLWESHRNTLYSIITRRLKANGSEPQGFLVFMISMADLYALLNGCGYGTFAEIVMKNQYISPRQCLPPLYPGSAEVFLPEEAPYFPKLLELDLEVLSLATRVGIVARDVRIVWADRLRRGEQPLADMDNCVWKNDVRALQATCSGSPLVWEEKYKELWTGQPSSSHTPLPSRVRAFWDHAYVLYRVSFILAHNCVYPGQRADPLSPDSVKISEYAADIISLARNIVIERRFDCQFIVLCLFFAGVISKNTMEKQLALDTLSTLENHTYGEHSTGMRRLLGAIYEQQRLAIAAGRQDVGIDWFDEVRSRGLPLVMWGI